MKGVKNSLWVLLTVLFCGVLTPVSADELKETQPNDEKIYVISIAEYGGGGRVSEAAKEQCGLEKSIPSAVVRFSDKYAVSAEIIALSDSVKEKQKVLSLKIEDVVGGRPGNGFGGRWVVSDLAATAVLTRDGKELRSNYFTCSAGLGFNLFANLKACDRLGRCSEQLGKKIALWLKKADSTDDSADRLRSNDTAHQQ